MDHFHRAEKPEQPQAENSDCAGCVESGGVKRYVGCGRFRTELVNRRYAAKHQNPGKREPDPIDGIVDRLKNPRLGFDAFVTDGRQKIDDEKLNSAEQKENDGHDRKGFHTDPAGKEPQKTSNGNPAEFDPFAGKLERDGNRDKRQRNDRRHGNKNIGPGRVLRIGGHGSKRKNRYFRANLLNMKKLPTALYFIQQENAD